MNCVFWCRFLNCYTGLATRDCKSIPSRSRPFEQAMAGLPESYPTGLAGKSTSAGLCHSQRLGKLDQQRIILRCLTVSYIPPQSSCFTFLTYDTFFLFPSSLGMLGIYRSFASLFFSFFYSVFLLFSVFPPEATCFVLSFLHAHSEQAAQLCELSTCPCATKEKRGIE